MNNNRRVRYQSALKLRHLRCHFVSPKINLKDVKESRWLPPGLCFWVLWGESWGCNQVSTLLHFRKFTDIFFYYSFHLDFLSGLVKSLVGPIAHIFNKAIFMPAISTWRADKTKRKQKPYKVKHEPLRRIKEPPLMKIEPLYGIIIPVNGINEIQREKYALSSRACVAKVTLLRGLVLCNRSRRDREPSRICVVNPTTWTASCSS